MLSEIVTKSKNYINDIKTRSAKRRQIVDELILSPHFQTWIYLDDLIRLLIEQSQDLSLKKVVQLSILQNYREIKSFATMIFLYSLQSQGRIDTDIPRTSWAVLYQQFCVNENQLIIFNSWAFNPQNYANIYDVIQSTLQMIGKNFQTFLSENSIPFTDHEFDSIVQWILRMRTQTPEKFEIASKLAWIIKDINIIKHEKDYITKEPLVMKKIFQNIGDAISDSGNAFLLLQPEEKYNEQTIEYFCHIQDYYLSDLNEEYLKNVFKNLSIGGITKSTLILIQKISSLLSNSEEYFKLRHIYQHFVLPYLTKFKAHKFLGQEVYNRVEFYALGFLRHCSIGKNGLEYLLEDIEEIENKNIQSQWISLTFAVGTANSLQDHVRKSIKEKGLEIPKQLSNLLIDPAKVWSVTLRTGKKYKKYIKNETREFRGIQNRANQCYIISVVQSLFFTEELQRLLDYNRQSIKSKQLLLDELRILFSELSGKRQTKNITIEYLKKLGPEEFRISESQEDSMQYLIQLFEKIENECKKIPGMLEKFNQIFKIDCQHTTKCLNCQKETTNVQNSYLHTIPHTQLLQLKTQEKEIQDYKCENCKKVGLCKNIREISPKCKIFIVHINRFSMKNGVCKKELSNQTILRKFLNYELVGMICHIGKNINSGHYKYFAKDKRNQNQWIELSDKNVLKFTLDKPNEQFEREMQTDMAPYILFYKRIN